MEDYLSSGEEDYYSDPDFGTESCEDDNQRRSQSVPSCQVITKESLLFAQREDLLRVMDMLTLSEQHSRTLLIYHRWDVEKLFAVLVEKGKDKLFSEAGVTVVDRKNISQLHSSSTMLCTICMEEIILSEMTAMDCSHCFCNNCWTEHFIVKINEGHSRRIRCMAYKCYDICDEAIIRDLVSARDPELAKRFERFLLESYIEDNKMVKWCPSVPHCGNAVRVEEDKYCEVKCACGLQFCFGCSSESHSPCSCLMWKLWMKKCRDESENNWLTVNTKSCPKCYKSVEKSGGCNLMSCLCGQAFCWLCGEATGSRHTREAIDGHSCGRFKEGEVKKVEQAKIDLYRYMHYHNRYKAHTDSFKLETKLGETIKDKIASLEDKLETKPGETIEEIAILEGKKLNLAIFDWVKNGHCRLLRSRRVLSYSYPFAFYMFGDELFSDEMTKEEKERRQHLFEDQQQQLEANVEKLSKILEEPFDQYPEDKVMDIRMQIINFSVTTDTLCKKMYECIENDLLGTLSTHTIAPYKSNGIEKASELSSYGSTNANNTESDSSTDV